MSSIHTNFYILAVEDDPLYAEGLELLLTELGYTHFSIVDNAIEALKIFKQQPPDLLLVDIELNGPLNGIELVEIVSAIRPTPVIYVTAFSDATTFNKAKQTRPSAYLLKPYQAKNLELAMELALFQNSGKETSEERENGAYKVDATYNAFFVKYNNRLIKIPISDLLFIEVDEKYCYVYTRDRRYAVNIRLKNLLDQLPAQSFIQTHRSFAVRLDAIEEVNLEDSIVKIAGKEIPVGKTYRESLFSRLKTL
jgi:DNA-binding LytR/AlgR family response regulator